MRTRNSLLTVCFVVLFVGCRGEETPEPGQQASDSGGAPPTQDGPAKEPSSPLPGDMGAIFDMGDMDGPLMGGMEGELVEPFESMTLEQFDAAWKTDLDVADRPAGDVLKELFAELDLAFEPAGTEEAQLAKPVTVKLPGCSRLQAVEEVCRLVGLYPSYQDPDAAGFMSFPSDDRPSKTTVTLSPGPRPHPVAFAGPVLVEVSAIESFPPHATGTLKLAIHTFALPPSVTGVLQENGDEAFTLEEVSDSGGQDLWDTDRFRMSWSPGHGSNSVPLKNLLRGLKSIDTVRGKLRIPVPTQVENLQFAKLEPGSTMEAEGVQVTLQEIEKKGSCSLRFDVTNLDTDEIDWQPLDARGNPLEVGGTGSFTFNRRAQVEFDVEGQPASLIANFGSGGSARFNKLEPGAQKDVAGGRIVLKSVDHSESCQLSLKAKGVDEDSIRIVPQDAQGSPLKTQEVFSSGFDKEVELQLAVQGQPASITASCSTGMEEIEYEFLLKDVPLGSLESMPEKIEPLQFPGHKVPVTIEFVAIVPDKNFPDNKDLKLRAVNHSNKDVRKIDMLLVYLDANGKKLKDFPGSHSGMLHGNTGNVETVVAKNATAEFDQSAFFMPEETKSAAATVRGVTFADATVWEPESAEGRPAKE